LSSKSLFAVAFLSLAAVLFSFGGITFVPATAPPIDTTVSSSQTSQPASVSSKSDLSENKLLQSETTRAALPTRSSKAAKSIEKVDDEKEKPSVFDSLLANLEKVGDKQPETTEGNSNDANAKNIMPSDNEIVYF
jgi:hypothetical protein